MPPDPLFKEKLPSFMPAKSVLINRYSIVVAICVLLGLLWYHTSAKAPVEFQAPVTFTIVSGESLHAISTHLKEQHLIRSTATFEIFAMLFGSDQHISEGDYYFERAIGSIEIARRIATADRHIEPIKVTLPEGLTRSEMAVALSEKLPDFDETVFLASTKEDEGFLFPDTYFFFPSTTTEEVILRLKNAFTEKIVSLEGDIIQSGHTLQDIVIMASIVEKEAGSGVDRAMISGILWKRLSLGMPLQVDASFLFINGKSSVELTQDDLAIDSLYNTYKYKDLPPGPIANPGLAALEAAIFPQESPYLFYLHDKNGMIHYAETFEGHKQNKALFL